MHISHVFLAGNSLSIVKYTIYRKKSLGNSLNSNIVKILIVVTFMFYADFDLAVAIGICHSKKKKWTKSTSEKNTLCKSNVRFEWSV